MLKFLFFYYVIINLVGFVSMYADKEKAKKGKFRTPERTLFQIAFIGGAVGSSISMHIYRHKTKHLQFKIGFPLLAAIQLGVIWYIFFV